MSTTRRLLAPLLALTAGVAIAATATAGAPTQRPGAAPVTPSAAWTIDRAASRVSLVLAGGGGPAVQGVFKRWTGQVAFDPAHAAQGRVTVSIDAASLVTGDPARDQALMGAGGLATSRDPHIVFTSRTIASRPDGGVNLVGDLALRGASHPATATGRLVRDGKGRRLDLTLAVPTEAFAPPGRPRPDSANLTVRLAARTP